MLPGLERNSAHPVSTPRVAALPPPDKIFFPFQVSTRDVLLQTAKLLGVEEDALGEVLTQQKRVLRGEEIFTPLDVDQVRLAVKRQEHVVTPFIAAALSWFPLFSVLLLVLTLSCHLSHFSDSAFLFLSCLLVFYALSIILAPFLSFSLPPHTAAVLTLSLLPYHLSHLSDSSAFVSFLLGLPLCRLATRVTR